MPDMTKKVALVTGASRGIGAAIAQRLATDGFNVLVNYVSDAKSAEEVAETITTAGGNALAVQADVCDSGAVERMFATAQDVFGGVDVLVNNAGILTRAPITETDDETFDRLVSINLKGTFNTLRVAAKSLRAGGRIINTSTSIIGSYLPNYAVYAATKAGVEAMTRILAKELGGRAITVNAIAPGPTATELFFTDAPQTMVNHITQITPLGRLGKPEDISNVVAFLAGPDAGWVNGQVLGTSGGMSQAPWGGGIQSHPRGKTLRRAVPASYVDMTRHPRARHCARVMEKLESYLP